MAASWGDDDALSLTTIIFLFSYNLPTKNLFSGLNEEADVYTGSNLTI